MGTDAHGLNRTECIDHGKKGMATGYSVIRLSNPRRTALEHRVVYAKKAGVTLDSIAGLVVRHTCDNPRCINEDHLVIGTHKQNTGDAIERGRFCVGQQSKTSKLTEDKVRAIFVAGGTHASIAESYGVNRKTVSRIKSGEDWKHLHLTED